VTTDHLCVCVTPPRSSAWQVLGQYQADRTGTQPALCPVHERLFPASPGQQSHQPLRLPSPADETAPPRARHCRTYQAMPSIHPYALSLSLSLLLLTLTQQARARCHSSAHAHTLNPERCRTPTSAVTAPRALEQLCISAAARGQWAAPFRFRRQQLPAVLTSLREAILERICSTGTRPARGALPSAHQTCAQA
jgi:hypothetical protein